MALTGSCRSVLDVRAAIPVREQPKRVFSCAHRSTGHASRAHITNLANRDTSLNTLPAIPVSVASYLMHAASPVTDLHLS